jgi:NAD(P)-dependent dehydrogenase (short-subunit alcohol dehydrogenase family)
VAQGELVKEGTSVGADYLAKLFGLTDQVALVTGARQGIGAAIASALSRAGARVVVTSRDGDSLREVAGELDRTGEHLELELDPTDSAQVTGAIAAAHAQWGRLDIVVNNAGMSIRKGALDLEAEEWDAVMAANLRAAFLVAQAGARVMHEGGSILNVSSTFARAAVARRAAYAASKAGLEQLTRVLAVEWAPLGIRVNAVAPTTVMTASRRDLFPTDQAKEQRIAQIPLGRLGAVDDVIGACLLLVSPAGAFITGETVVVDGGYTLGPVNPR